MLICNYSGLMYDTVFSSILYKLKGIPKWLSGIQSHHFMENRWGNSGKRQTLFFWAPKSLQMVTAAMKLKEAYSLEGKLWPT